MNISYTQLECLGAVCPNFDPEATECVGALALDNSNEPGVWVPRRLAPDEDLPIELIRDETATSSGPPPLISDLICNVAEGDHRTMLSVGSSLRGDDPRLLTMDIGCDRATLVERYLQQQADQIL